MSLAQNLQRSTSLLAAVDSMRNWRALVLLLGSFVAAFALFAVGGVLGTKVHMILMAVFGLLACLCLFYGLHAAGITLMQDAKGVAAPSLTTAMLSALATGHRLLLVMLLVFLAYLGGILAVALLLVICKIPGVGPLLFMLVFPAIALISGIAATALFVVVFPLAAPAIWDGATSVQAFSRLLTIARARVVNVLLMMVLLGMLVMLVAGVVVAIVASGTAIATAMSVGIVGLNGVSLLGLMAIVTGEGGGGGYLLGAGLGGGLLWAVAFSLPVLVYVRGCCEVYRANLEGLDLSAVEDRMKAGIAAARRRIEEVQAQAAEAAKTTLAPAPALVTDPVGFVAAPARAACPACGGSIVLGDTFCGGCGHKLA